MAPEGVAIFWGLKEPAYGAAPLLPALDQVLPQELAALEQQVSQGHAVHGSEISFYWCFPFWVLAAQLQSQGIAMAGLSDFEAARRIPQLIVLVDLPLQRSGLQRLISRFKITEASHRNALGLQLSRKHPEGETPIKTDFTAMNRMALAHLLLKRCQLLGQHLIESREQRGGSIGGLLEPPANGHPLRRHQIAVAWDCCCQSC